MAGRLFTLLGLDAGRTLFKDRVMMLELGDAFDIFVSMIKIIITRMAEALMPK